MTEGTVRVFRNGGGVSVLLWVVPIIAILVGIPGLIDRVISGHVSMGFGNFITWGLWASMYIFLMGVGTGAFFVSSMDFVFRWRPFVGSGPYAILVSLVSMFGSLFLIWLDLGHGWRIWRVFLHPNFTSVMAQIVWLYTIAIVLELAMLVLLYREQKGGIHGHSLVHRALVIARLPVSIAAMSGLGALLGVQASQPYWHVGLFPVQFVLFAIASGGAMLLVVVAVRPVHRDAQRQRELLVTLARWTLVFNIFKFFFLWSDLVMSYYGGLPENLEAINLMLFGPHAWVFWVLQLVLGTLLPIAILSVPRLQRAPGWAGSAGLVTLVGFAAARLNIVIPGLAVEPLKGLSTAFADPRLRLDYVPTVQEWLVVAFVFGAVALAYQIGERLLPAEPSSTETA